MEFTYKLNEIDRIAKTIIDLLKYDCVVFNAPMGAGKTTLIKSLCAHLGIDNTVSSPTFSLVNEYKNKNVEILHFDLYRIEDKNELYEIGMEDYLDRRSFKFIEWPALVIDLLDDYHVIAIDIIESDMRKLTFN